MYYYTYPNWQQPQGFNRSQMPYANGNFNPNNGDLRITEETRATGINDMVSSALIAAMEGESEAIDFYTRLAAMAPNNEARGAVQHALEDEKKHLELFINLYKQLTGKNPDYKKRRKRFSNFTEGIKLAFHDEVEAYEAYRDAYLLTGDHLIRDVFFEAMTDEMDHATRFSFIYHGLK